MRFQRILDGTIMGMLTGLSKDPDYCPHCGKHIDAATGSTGHLPDPGDFSVCAYCVKVMVFGDTLKLRLPTAAEAKTAASDPEVRRIQTGLKKINRRLKRKRK